MEPDVSLAPVHEFEPNDVLRKLVDAGFSLSAHVPADCEVICQELIEDAALLFFEQAQDDVLGLERLLANIPVTLADDLFFMQARDHAHNLRGQAQVLGFSLITTISGHMIDSIAHEHMPDAMKYQMVRRITEVLRLAFNQKIQDAGGPKGVELLAVVEGYLALPG